MAVVVHSGSLGGAFLDWDDDWLVSGNPRVVEGGLSDLGDMLDPGGDRKWYGHEYLPLRDLSNRLDRALWGMNPVGYHLGNVLLFGLAAAALLAVIFALTGDRRAAVIGSLLFAVHPITTESVACIAHRKDVLMAAFVLTAWLAWLRERRVLTLVLFVAAVLSKLPAVVFPGLAVLGDLLLKRRFDVRRIAWLAALAAVSLGGVVTSAKVAPALGAAQWHGGSIATNALSVGVAFLEGCRLLLVPVGLHVGRVNEAMTRTSPDAASVAGLALLLALVVGGAVALLGYRRRPTTGRGIVAVAALGLVIVQVPYLQIRPFWVLFAERYLILATVPVCIAAGLLLVRLAPRPRAGAVVVLAIVLSAMTWRRESDWRDTQTLFLDAIEKAPRSYLALEKMGHRRMLEGRLVEAKGLLGRAVAATDGYGDLGQAHLDEIAQGARWDLVNVNMGLGLADEARATAGEIRERWPDSWRGPFFEGLIVQSRAMAEDGRSVEAKLRDLAAAEARYAKALELIEKAREAGETIDASVASVHHNLGLIHHMREGHGSERAVAAHERAVEINPDMPEAWEEIAKLYEHRSRWTDAARAWRRMADLYESKLNRRAEASVIRRRAREVEKR
jgi:tetratricopeptide (TPR) repeat protein